MHISLTFVIKPLYYSAKALTIQSLNKVKKKAAKKKVAKKKAATSAVNAETELSRKEVTAVLDSLTGLIEKNIKPRGPGFFNLPGLLKIKVIKKPATKARKGTNPFTGEEMMFKAKPARKVVKVLPLKGLKDMV